MIPTNALFPVLVVQNLPPLKSYYEAHFGFQAVFYDPSFYLHLMHPEGGYQVGFLMPDHPSQPDFLRKPMSAQGFVLSLEVDDAEAACHEARQSRLDVVLELRDEPWGQRHFIVRDPAGFHIDVVQHLETPDHLCAISHP